MRKKILIATFLIIYTILSAKKIDKAFEALKVYNYFKAKELFEKLLEKEIVAAPYGLSLIFERNDNPFYDLDSAYKYILKADSNFLKLKTKQIERLTEIDVDSMKIESLKDSIDKKIYFSIERSEKIVDFEKYIKDNKDSEYLTKAIARRNELAFYQARKLNTSKAYEFFFTSFPEAEEAIEAKNRFEERRFIEQTSNETIKEYQSYVEEFPQSPYTRTAHDSIFSISVKDKKIASYHSFIKENPHNPNLEKAWRLLYKLYMIDYRPEKIVEFRIDYPDYPFVEELKSDIRLAVKQFLPFKRNNQWGFMDELGEVMISEQYSSVENFSEDLALVVKNGEVGYINKSGEIVIPIIYEDGESFKNGLAIVIKDDLYGMINRANKEIIPLQYDFMGSLSDGLALVAKGSKYGYLNKRGEVIVPIQFDYATDFENGYAVIERNGKKGIINTLGEVIIPTNYSWLEPFTREGLCRIKNDSLFGIADKNGAIVVPFEYQRIGDLNRQLILIAKNDKYGYLDKNFEQLTPINFEFREETLLWGEYEGGFTKFLLKNKYGVIDSLGERVFPAIFENIGTYRPVDLVAVKKRGKWGYTNQNLKLVIPYDYNFAYSFSNKCGLVKKDSIWGVLDIKGDWLIQPQFKSIEQIDSCYIVQKSGQYGLLDKDLNPLLDVTFEKIEKSNFSLYLGVQREGNYYYYSIKDNMLIIP